MREATRRIWSLLQTFRSVIWRSFRRIRSRLGIRTPKKLELPPGDFFATRHDPPYISQFATRERVSSFLADESALVEDEHWREFGFETVDQYAFWAPRLCGISCLKMALEAVLEPPAPFPVSALVDRAVEMKGYRLYDESGNFIDRGWYYSPLIKLAKALGASGEALSHVEMDDICRTIINGRIFIASVHPGLIRGDVVEASGRRQGGHLVVVFGFRWGDSGCEGYYLHNPSGRSRKTQQRYFVDTASFDAAFAGRGFAIWNDSVA